jgi:hypothetical protein
MDMTPLPWLPILLTIYGSPLYAILNFFEVHNITSVAMAN